MLSVTLRCCQQYGAPTPLTLPVLPPQVFIALNAVISASAEGQTGLEAVTLTGRLRSLTSEVTRCCASCSLDPWIQVPVELAMSRAVASSRCRAPCSHKPPVSGPAGACQVCIALPRTLHSLQLALVSEVCIGSRCHDVTPPLPSPCSCRHAQELRALPLPRYQASSAANQLRRAVACLA